MYRTIIHVAVGLMLVGCTTNANITSSYHYGVLDFDRVLKNPKEVVEEAVVVPEPPEEHKPTLAEINRAKQCAVYKPLPSPKPVQVDLNLIKSLKTAEQVNEVLVLNIATLNEQMRSHAKAQTAHYQAWLKKCQHK